MVVTVGVAGPEGVSSGAGDCASDAAGERVGEGDGEAVLVVLGLALAVAVVGGVELCSGVMPAAPVGCSDSAAVDGTGCQGRCDGTVAGG